MSWKGKTKKNKAGRDRNTKRPTRSSFHDGISDDYDNDDDGKGYYFLTVVMILKFINLYNKNNTLILL